MFQGLIRWESFTRLFFQQPLKKVFEQKTYSVKILIVFYVQASLLNVRNCVRDVPGFEGGDPSDYFIESDSYGPYVNFFIIHSSFESLWGSIEEGSGSSQH